MSEREDMQKVMKYDAERIVDEVIQERVDKAIYQLIGKRVKEATESLYDYVDNVVADIKTPNSPRGEVRYFGGSLIHNRQDSSSIDFLQYGTGATATNLQAKIRSSVPYDVVVDFGADNTGATDASTAINNAIAAAAAAGGGVVFLPEGKYKIGTTLNLVNLQQTPITLRGAGRPRDTINSAPSEGSALYGLTGAFAVIETQGSHYVHLEDFGIYSLTADTSRSCVGIFIGRTTVQASAQFHDYRRVSVTLATNPTANASRGTIALYNFAGEIGRYDHLDLTSDTPLELSDGNALSYAPKYGTLSGSSTSTLNEFTNCVFEALTNKDMELRGVQSTSFLDCYYGTNTAGVYLGIAVQITTGSAKTMGVRFTGQTETFNTFLEAEDGTGYINIDVSFSCPLATGPMILVDVANNQVVTGLNAHFTNPNSVTLPIVGVGAASGSTLRGGRLVLERGSTLNSSSLVLQGTRIIDMNSSAATVAVDASSIYSITRTNGPMFEGQGCVAVKTNFPTYSASITPDARKSNVFEILVTDANAFTINAPSNPTSGQIIVIEILNNSGGAMGTVTFGSGIRTTGAFTSPASTKVRNITLHYDGSNWLETARASADL